MAQKRKKLAQDQADSQHVRLSAPTASLDPALSSLFASSSGPVKATVAEQAISPLKESSRPKDRSPELCGLADSNDPTSSKESLDDPFDVEAGGAFIQNNRQPARKRRKIDPTEDLEARYLDRLAQEDTEESAVDPPKRPGADGEASEAGSKDTSSELDTAVPLHETLTHETNEDDSIRNKRTVFFGNVSTTAIKSKSAKKTLLNHLSSPLSSLPPSTDPHKIDSIRFRSVAFSNNIPRKAAYAKKELMDETTKSTNAYAVYSTETAARRAVRQLNGTVILDRHLRADLVAHPSKIEPRRCIFVGNLSFVDEETSQNTTEDEPSEQKKQRRKKTKPPSDAEEGLWRTFSRCGTVESVRVIRDKSTRVGKGFAYVQFTDENAVEAALLYNEKSFPPMLPRRLRVVRAKGLKRRDDGRRRGDQRSKGPVQAKNQSKSFKGKVARLAGDAASTGTGKRVGIREESGGIKKPESFVFEGHRASKTKDKVPGSKLKVKSGKKPENRSTRRAAAYRATGAGKGTTKGS